MADFKVARKQSHVSENTLYAAEIQICLIIQNNHMSLAT